MWRMMLRVGGLRVSRGWRQLGADRPVLAGVCALLTRIGRCWRGLRAPNADRCLSAMAVSQCPAV
jgi:hypothetical protein